jgi:hypothetical protein
VPDDLMLAAASEFTGAAPAATVCPPHRYFGDGIGFETGGLGRGLDGADEIGGDASTGVVVELVDVVGLEPVPEAAGEAAVCAEDLPTTALDAWIELVADLSAAAAAAAVFAWSPAAGPDEEPDSEEPAEECVCVGAEGAGPVV